MSKRAGQLLWNRIKFDIAADGETIVDTEIAENLSSKFNSASEPPWQTGPDPSAVASRIQVVPLAPVDAWLQISHGEPYILNGTVHVNFNNTNGDAAAIGVNCLFWDPHSVCGPGEADLYGG